VARSIIWTAASSWERQPVVVKKAHARTASQAGSSCKQASKHRRPFVWATFIYREELDTHTHTHTQCRRILLYAVIILSLDATVGHGQVRMARSRLASRRLDENGAQVDYWAPGFGTVLEVDPETNTYNTRLDLVDFKEEYVRRTKQG